MTASWQALQLEASLVLSLSLILFSIPPSSQDSLRLHTSMLKPPLAQTLAKLLWDWTLTASEEMHELEGWNVAVWVFIPDTAGNAMNYPLTS